ncbi:hypothetical protein PPSIR1_19889 [Plesiocystis pacifica SIR-1]|uniref:STAS/SEC14 domain-containing protein n=1 Tax=Plesiocystis pacifica SIR-1 TaxID=391625 RepID=A6GDT0_9BACT|nr:STAS/SEC14 domain-containing protein [Plesiocystis pacifica]EDM75969.1 hypothetical protein PPSIR1_19889 [Plesiocystis pacifica SIR-1]
MDHRVRWDEANHCARIELVGEFRPEHVDSLLDQSKALIHGLERRLVLLDHAESPGAIPRATRRELEARAAELDYHRMAFCGMDNFNRVVARIIIALIGRSDRVGFFEDQAQALAWLREG